MPIRLRRDVPPLIALLLLACLPFSEAVLDPSQFPVGLDSVQHYSRESFVRRALSAGVLPGWNPYEFSGFPALADPQTGVFYLPSVVLRVLALPAFLTWTVVFHIWVFGAGAYVLCRVVGVDRWVALLAAVGLMLGGITMPRVYAGHLDVLRTVAWVPLALALAIRSIDRGTIWPSALLIVVLSLQVLGSFLQLSVYTLAAVALYALFSAMWPPSGEPSWGRTRTLSAHLMLVVLFVLGMTAIQLVPTARLIAAAGRTGGMEYAGAVAPAIGLDELTRFVLPSLDVTIPPESWETSSYIGLLAAVIAPAAVWATRRRRFVAFFVLLALATVMLAVGSPLYRLHHLLFPMFRIPGRLIVFWSLAVCVLGAVALDWFTAQHSPAANGSRTSRWNLAALLLATIVVPVDLALYALRFVDVRGTEDRFVQSVPFAPSPGGRVLALCDSDLRSGELSALGIASVDGYNSYFLRGYAGFAQLSQGEPVSEQIFAYPRISAATADRVNWPLVSMLNVTEVVSCEPLVVRGLDLIAHHEPFYVYRNTLASGRVSSVCDSAESPHFIEPCAQGDEVKVKLLSADQPDGTLRFETSSATPQSLLLSEPYYRERRAWIDGVETEVRNVNLALSEISVGSGTHVIELRYVPTSLYVGAGISFATLLVLGWRNKKQRAAEPPDGGLA